jgi:selenide,water dikinase
MPPPLPAPADLALLGAGHAHAEVLRQAALGRLPGLRLTLIAREAMTPYSGMLPGLIRGEYRHAEAHLDCARLAAAAGARLVLDAATGLDLAARRVTFADHAPVGFDLLSIDVGGEPVQGQGGVPVKPVGRFLDQLAALEARHIGPMRLAVVGGGASGVELAIALAIRLGQRAKITLVNADATPLAAAPRSARKAVAAALAREAIDVRNGVRALAFSNELLRLADGADIPADEVLWATGVRGPSFLAASGLACDAASCVRVDACLRSLSHPTIFAAGDCATVDGAARPKAGVWAVRAGAPLAENLRRAAAGVALKPWRPQASALAILGLGHGRAVAWRGGLAVSGHWVARWKSRIDRRWMAVYQALG